MAVNITGTKAVTEKPVKPSLGGMITGWFSDTPFAYTKITNYWCNDVQQEILSAITGAGLAADPDDQTQLSQAIERKLRKAGDTMTGQLVLDMSDPEKLQEPIVSNDWFELERVVLPHQFDNHGDSERIPYIFDTTSVAIFDHFTGWFRGKDFRYVAREVEGAEVSGPDLRAHDVILALGQTDLVTENPICYFPIKAVPNRYLKELRLYGLSYDATTARTLSITLQRKSPAGYGWENMIAWDRSYPLATEGGSQFVRVSECYGATSGDYFFNDPTFFNWGLSFTDYHADGFLMETDKLYRLKVELTNGPAMRSYGSPEDLFYRPFDYVGITGLKVVTRQKRMLV